MAPILPKFTIKPGYRSQSSDTTPEADLLGFWLLKQRTPEQRLLMGSSMNQNARRFAINCFRQRFFDLKEPEFAQKLAQAWLAEDCPQHYIPTGGDSLDKVYLNNQAKSLNLVEDLNQALIEAGLEET